MRFLVVAVVFYLIPSKRSDPKEKNTKAGFPPLLFEIVHTTETNLVAMVMPHVFH